MWCIDATRSDGLGGVRIGNPGTAERSGGAEPSCAGTDAHKTIPLRTTAPARLYVGVAHMLRNRLLTVTGGGPMFRLRESQWARSERDARFSVAQFAPKGNLLPKAS